MFLGHEIVKGGWQGRLGILDRRKRGSRRGRLLRHLAANLADGNGCSGLVLARAHVADLVLIPAGQALRPLEVGGVTWSISTASSDAVEILQRELVEAFEGHSSFAESAGIRDEPIDVLPGFAVRQGRY
jgi:hypothetical protein